MWEVNLKATEAEETMEEERGGMKRALRECGECGEWGEQQVDSPPMRPQPE